jgi:hypothetical protein
MILSDVGCIGQVKKLTYQQVDRELTLSDESRAFHLPDKDKEVNKFTLNVEMPADLSIFRWRRHSCA